jgi:hypothetical protein
MGPLIAKHGLFLLLLGVVAPRVATAQEFTTEFDRERCTFATTGSNPYFPLWPGYALLLEGEEEDDEGEIVEIEALLTVTTDTELVDGVLTRVVEERESEDGELVEVSRNFMAHCRETGDVWYFGEDVDDYEDGEIVGHEGGWRAGIGGALPGLIMPGTPLLGARFQQELALGVAEDRGEVVALEENVTIGGVTFERVLRILDTNALSPSSEGDVKLYAHGIGIVADEELELTEVTQPPCRPDELTHCLSNGRFRVSAEWQDAAGNEGDAHAILASADSGEFWFFESGNTELLVKVLDTCANPQFDAFWVFAAGLTDVEVTLTVTDTQSGQMKVYGNELGEPFSPVLDTAAFATCP